MPFRLMAAAAFCDMRAIHSLPAGLPHLQHTCAPRKRKAIPCLGPDSAPIHARLVCKRRHQEPTTYEVDRPPRPRTIKIFTDKAQAQYSLWLTNVLDLNLPLTTQLPSTLIPRLFVGSDPRDGELGRILSGPAHAVVGHPSTNMHPYLLNAVLDRELLMQDNDIRDL
ncbi:hypothetical protein CKAH01_03805 [Colletotrichum kahawae]|uniref:Uncharacterized protein n=1 Tax=Colletotrichum kahawae TaxID=34407 RepID=A0AAD9YMS1_COLKA|nr:hypothetical protein CKAH01_03805 [Colletotrichum kahawae]